MSSEISITWEEEEKHCIFKSLRLDRISDWNRMELSWENKQQIYLFYDCMNTGVKQNFRVI